MICPITNNARHLNNSMKDKWIPGMIVNDKFNCLIVDDA